MTTETQKYNGWTNYETWNVSLWMGNDQGTHEYWRQVASEAYETEDSDRYFTRKERAVMALADRLEAEVLEGNPIADQCSLYADILEANLKDVNWYEIAEHWINDLPEDELAEDDD